MALDGLWEAHRQVPSAVPHLRRGQGDKDGRKIAAVWGKDFEREATANLMVAAPALPDALRAVIRVADRKTVEFDSARAALAMLDDDQLSRTQGA